ncbi:META domain-containing protein [Simiduia agarivorans]|uniref:Heat shock protein HslJ n=1 Tax=Simiduia agarivorans (strain DSM 21679 / JCM 13881 / BCRC 17597 / SA1) TaxID=1117647 RepID=K4KM29_SIMAS|nr:META domain-containing protein [Simiduia agarivorans]AFV00215.1 heat shock protein HslJ [Simiduia agarivorans SA1 = DSM 21679]
MKRVALVFVSLAGLMVAACGHTPEAEPAKPVTVADLAHHRWVLKTVDGEPAFSKPVGTYDKGLVPDLDFGEAPHAGGFAGCNRYKGQFELNEQGQFRIARVATTMMMCEPKAMAFEKQFTDMLGQWTDITLADNQLSLTADGKVWLFTLQDWVQ